ncbi:MAG: hypothetical protein AAFW81_02740 [Pseudomonadota bacterium]
MRVVTGLIFLLTGIGCVVYSYIGTYLRLADDMANAEDVDAAATPFFALLGYILDGGAPPRLSTFLYLGALLIAISIVTLIVNPKKDHDRQDTV